ncbi:MAG TPA: hypothetical protein VF833_05005 [Gaiellaceae bacterium]
MIGGNSLNEIVLFEVPALSGATQLLAELSTARLAWMERGDDVSVIGVLLNPDEDDLARLLREVEAWVGTRGLLAVRFEVDGRTYALHNPVLAERAHTAA